jgi:hypothetical protein
MSKKRHISFWLTEEDMNGYQHQILMPVIFCKDCKFWDYEVDNDVGFCVRTEDCDWDANDFCSRGELK